MPYAEPMVLIDLREYNELKGNSPQDPTDDYKKALSALIFLLGIETQGLTFLNRYKYRLQELGLEVCFSENDVPSIVKIEKP